MTACEGASEPVGHARAAMAGDRYQHVLPSMDERTADAVANLILGDGEPEAESAASTAVTGPSGPCGRRRGAVARDRSSVGVSEGRSQP
jgi:hypothetical protein